MFVWIRFQVSAGDCEVEGYHVESGGARVHVGSRVRDLVVLVSSLGF